MLDKAEAEIQSIPDEGCDICGEPAKYSVCETCGAKRDARYVFKLCFVDDLALQVKKGIRPEKKIEYASQNKRVWKDRISNGLFDMTDAEKSQYHTDFENEYKLLEGNPNMANRIMHFDAENNKFWHHEIHWFDDMRLSNIHKYCGTCLEYPCKKMRDRTHIREIIRCSEKRQ